MGRRGLRLASGGAGAVARVQFCRRRRWVAVGVWSVHLGCFRIRRCLQLSLRSLHLRMVRPYPVPKQNDKLKKVFKPTTVMENQRNENATCYYLIICHIFLYGVSLLNYLIV